MGGHSSKIDGVTFAKRDDFARWNLRNVADAVQRWKALQKSRTDALRQEIDERAREQRRERRRLQREAEAKDRQDDLNRRLGVLTGPGNPGIAKPDVDFDDFDLIGASGDRAGASGDDVVSPSAGGGGLGGLLDAAAARSPKRRNQRGPQGPPSKYGTSGKRGAKSQSGTPTPNAAGAAAAGAVAAGGRRSPSARSPAASPARTRPGTGNASVGSRRSVKSRGSAGGHSGSASSGDDSGSSEDEASADALNASPYVTRREWVDLMTDYGVVSRGEFLTLPMHLFRKFDNQDTGNVVGEEVLFMVMLWCDAATSEKIRFVFEFFDSDDIGKLAKQDFRRLIASTLGGFWKLGINKVVPEGRDLKKICDHMFSRADVNKDDYVSLPEFTAWAHVALTSKQLIKMFQGDKPVTAILDSDGTGPANKAAKEKEARQSRTHKKEVGVSKRHGLARVGRGGRPARLAAKPDEGLHAGGAASGAGASAGVASAAAAAATVATAAIDPVAQLREKAAREAARKREAASKARAGARRDSGKRSGAAGQRRPSDASDGDDTEEDAAKAAARAAAAAHVGGGAADDAAASEPRRRSRETRRSGFILPGNVAALQGGSGAGAGAGAGGAAASAADGSDDDSASAASPPPRATPQQQQQQAQRRSSLSGSISGAAEGQGQARGFRDGRRRSRRRRSISKHVEEDQHAAEHNRRTSFVAVDNIVGSIAVVRRLSQEMGPEALAAAAASAAAAEGAGGEMADDEDSPAKIAARRRGRRPSIIDQVMPEAPVVSESQRRRVEKQASIATTITDASAARTVTVETNVGLRFQEPKSAVHAGARHLAARASVAGSALSSSGISSHKSSVRGGGDRSSVGGVGMMKRAVSFRDQMLMEQQERPRKMVDAHDRAMLQKIKQARADGIEGKDDTSSDSDGDHTYGANDRMLFSNDNDVMRFHARIVQREKDVRNKKRRTIATKRELKIIHKTTTFSHVEVHRIVEGFVDASNVTGQLNRKRFGRALKMVVPAFGTFERGRLFDMADADGDGAISLREFCAHLNLVMRGSPEDKLALMFDIYDVNKNGFIQTLDIVRFIKQGWQRHTVLVTKAINIANQIMQLLDVDGDGSITRAEFAVSMARDPQLVETFAQCIAISKDMARALHELAAVCPEFSSEQMLKLLRSLDGDSRSEFIRRHTLDDFRLFMSRGFGCGPEVSYQVDSIFEAFDTDGVGQVILRDILNGFVQIMGTSVAQQTEYYFDLYDMNGDGTLDRNEIMHMLLSSQTKTNEDAAAVIDVINLFDPTGQGKVTRKRFQRLGFRDTIVMETLDHMFEVHCQLDELFKSVHERRRKKRALELAATAFQGKQGAAAKAAHHLKDKLSKSRSTDGETPSKADGKKKGGGGGSSRKLTDKRGHDSDNDSSPERAGSFKVKHKSISISIAARKSESAGAEGHGGKTVGRSSSRRALQPRHMVVEAPAPIDLDVAAAVMGITDPDDDDAEVVDTDDEEDDDRMSIGSGVKQAALVYDSKNNPDWSDGESEVYTESDDSDDEAQRKDYARLMRQARNATVTRYRGEGLSRMKGDEEKAKVRSQRRRRRREERRLKDKIEAARIATEKELGGGGAAGGGEVKPRRKRSGTGGSDGDDEDEAPTVDTDDDDRDTRATTATSAMTATTGAAPTTAGRRDGPLMSPIETRRRARTPPGDVSGNGSDESDDGELPPEQIEITVTGVSGEQTVEVLGSAKDAAGKELPAHRRRRKSLHRAAQTRRAKPKLSPADINAAAAAAAAMTAMAGLQNAGAKVSLAKKRDPSQKPSMYRAARRASIAAKAQAQTLAERDAIMKQAAAATAAREAAEAKAKEDEELRIAEEAAARIAAEKAERDAILKSARKRSAARANGDFDLLPGEESDSGKGPGSGGKGTRRHGPGGKGRSTSRSPQTTARKRSSTSTSPAVTARKAATTTTTASGTRAAATVTATPIKTGKPRNGKTGGKQASKTADGGDGGGKASPGAKSPLGAKSPPPAPARRRNSNFQVGASDGGATTSMFPSVSGGELPGSESPQAKQALAVARGRRRSSVHAIDVAERRKSVTAAAGSGYGQGRTTKGKALGPDANKVREPPAAWRGVLRREVKVSMNTPTWVRKGVETAQRRIVNAQAGLGMDPDQRGRKAGGRVVKAAHLKGVETPALTLMAPVDEDEHPEGAGAMQLSPATSSATEKGLHTTSHSPIGGGNVAAMGRDERAGAARDGGRGGGGGGEAAFWILPDEAAKVQRQIVVGGGKRGSVRRRSIAQAEAHAKAEYDAAHRSLFLSALPIGNPDAAAPPSARSGAGNAEAGGAGVGHSYGGHGGGGGVGGGVPGVLAPGTVVPYPSVPLMVGGIPGAGPSVVQPDPAAIYGVGAAPAGVYGTGTGTGATYSMTAGGVKVRAPEVPLGPMAGVPLYSFAPLPGQRMEAPMPVVAGGIPVAASGPHGVPPPPLPPGAVGMARGPGAAAGGYSGGALASAVPPHLGGGGGGSGRKLGRVDSKRNLTLFDSMDFSTGPQSPNRKLTDEISNDRLGGRAQGGLASMFGLA